MKPIPEQPDKGLPAPVGTESFCILLRRALLALAVCSVLVTLAYLYIDRPAAYFAHEQHLGHVEALHWMTSTAMVLNALASILVVWAVIKLAWAPPTRLDRTLLAASISLIVAVFLEYYLKFLFGRYWPDTWVNNNPSLIHDSAYGFHPFHFGEAYGSFPSGHSARVFAALSVVWIAYPRFWLPGLLICISVMVGLVLLNHHFVSDTIAGAFLGSLTGMYAACFFGVQPPRPVAGAP